MGMFDDYGTTQLKVGPCVMASYQVGDAVEIRDGLYLGWDGFVLIQDGKMAGEWAQVTDTHGNTLPARTLLGRAWHGDEWRE